MYVNMHVCVFVCAFESLSVCLFVYVCMYGSVHVQIENKHANMQKYFELLLKCTKSEAIKRSETSLARSRSLLKMCVKRSLLKPMPSRRACRMPSNVK